MYESESESRSVVSNSLRPHGLYSLWNSPGQKTGVGSCSLLQGIFPTQRLNPSFPHCRRILYQLSHQGSPRILEWIAHLFSSGSSRPRNQFSFLDPFPLWVVLIFLLADQIPLVKSGFLDNLPVTNRKVQCSVQCFLEADNLGQPQRTVQVSVHS